jgi:hypothetical protein
LDAVHKARQESPFPAATLQRAGDVIEDPERDVPREVLEERLQQDKHIVLLLSPCLHVYEPEDSIVAAEKGHKPRVIEKVGAGFRTFFVGSLEGRLTCVEN